MVAFLITSFFLIAGITYVIYLWQRPSSNGDVQFSLAPPPQRSVSLFDDAGLNEAAARRLPAGVAAATEQRRALIERANSGDRGALLDAQEAGDAAVYDEVLN